MFEPWLANEASSGPAAAFARLGLRVLERGWLSSNNVVFEAGAHGGAAVVDTGYVAHAAQTVALVEHALQGHTLARIVNTHLHSDHCGGNAALQQRWPQAWTLVPAVSVPAVRVWDEERLTYRRTDQRCARFRVDAGLLVGHTVALGRAEWQVLAAPGHDPDAVMLFQPDEKVLIAGDALWEDGVAILFPELDGAPGLMPACAVLDAIERLAPAWVIPGHGAPFGPAGASLERARLRLERFAREPARHRDYAARALVMFHMLECGERPLAELVRWMLSVPLFDRIAAGVEAGPPREQWALAAVQRLIDGGALQCRDDRVRVPR